MKTQPVVSVIIPFYNQVNWLNEAVESVFIQTLTDFEIIIVNDGSPEDISSFLKKYKDKIIYKYKTNGGPATARNLGIEISKGKYIAFLDSDDIWEKTKLEEQVKFMEETNAIWSHSSYKFFKDNSNYSLIEKNLSYFKGNVFPRVLVSSPIATPCIMIQTDFFRKNPLIRFNEDMRYGQDWYLWIHIAINEPLFFLPLFLVKVRLHGNNASKRGRIQLKTKSDLWKTMQNKPDVFFGKNKVNHLMKFSYRLCLLGNKLVELIEQKITKNSNILEFISKVLYLIPYVTLKGLNRFYFRT